MKWFPPLVVMPPVPAQPTNPGVASKDAPVSLVPMPSGVDPAAKEEMDNYREIVFPPEKFSHIPKLSITAADRINETEDAGSSSGGLRMLPDIVLPSETKPRGDVSGVRKEEPAHASETKPPAVEVSGARMEPENDFVREVPLQAAPSPSEPDFTDKDLTEAFAPLIESIARRVVVTGDRDKLDALLEPMLRATVRRALAEYSPSRRPFEAPGFVDKTIWRMQALFSSRTYEEVFFEKTHRFQVEEVYLLDAQTLALVSFASCDPARHSTVKRVEGSAKRVAQQIRENNGEIRRSFEAADGRNVIAERGEYLIMVAIVRGQANEMMLADLEFSLKRIEEHFRERFQEAGSALMHALQPFLEDCLLIQSPANAA
ncbi:hypothetical protein ACFSSA_04620 [Luteolibacter algae]|uniref:Uncharacterized protein n=1 Tax=Luteolibacter algae TaxID=454151 RepID=A0ABW5D4F8_9BACT